MSVSLERELRNLMKTGEYVIGTRQTLKLLKLGKLKMVIMAKNAPPEVRKRVEYYARLSGTPVLVYEGTSVELGQAIGKPFTAALIGIVEEGTSRILELVE